MISTTKLTVRFGARTLFENVSIKFSPGNCYGLIGANGSGKTTLLKILSGEIEPTSGEVHVSKGQRIAVLKQNHFEFDQYRVIDTVIMGHKKLYDVMQEKEALYSKPDFNEEDGMRVAQLEIEFGDLNGWEAESQVASLLSDLGIDDALHFSLMSELSGSEKVRVLLAQALFDNPDILLLDEPTNHLDTNTIAWVEEFLINFQNTVIVVSHDRKFLDNVCTHMADIDFCNIQLYAGNYTFWSEASQLIQRQKQEQNRKTEEKIEELKAFIARFSANASKSKQATSRKNILNKLSLEDIKPSSRKYPAIRFGFPKMPGKEVLRIEKLNKSIDGNLLIKNFSLEVQKGDKIAFLSRNPLILTTLFSIIAGEIEPDSGTCKWGTTATQAYFPKDNTKFFKTNMNLIDWLRQYSPDQNISFLRGFLGKMLFSGEESEKCDTVLSGGERVRCMLSKMMVAEANVLIFDEPTNHLDLEAITSLNNALIDFNGTIFFTSQDYQFIQTVANRIVEISPNGWINSHHRYSDYLVSPDIKKRRENLLNSLISVNKKSGECSKSSL
ncbi:MAG: ABC transporter ATP-binding protein [Candidatus Melainabacteria bacterium GWF2_37_15]|nr:MAG: ABC transporter ATP-binding protein [Candidatus Melainabacteria bacterium GWF2_37_15]